MRRINRRIEATGWYSNSFWGGVTKFWKIKNFDLDIVNLGSSVSVYDYYYSDLKYRCANWALGPQSLVHDFNILKNYFSYIRTGGIVLITICPFSGLISKYDKRHNLKYYTILHPATIQNFEETELIRALQIKASPFTYMPLLCVKNTIKEHLVRALRCIRPLSDKVPLEDTANAMMTNWKNQFGISNLSLPPSDQHKQELELRKETLDNMVSFCKERSFKPVVVIPPMHHSLSKLFPQEFKGHYIDPILKDLEAPVLDFMNDTRFHDDNLYRTALFLNKEGSKKFTYEVIKMLEAITECKDNRI